ncbi:MAG: GNAT family N-acetyltransferase [Gammaproteobacteria bacterium]|nr:GNAT family N-acetyltransferase [Gammaproteobacteria bacterium]
MELYRRQRSVGGAPAGIFLVASPATDPERVLGFIIGEIRAWEFGSDPCGWVYALSVRPEARERGVGEALLKAIAEAFRRAGMGKMRTMVARDAILPMQFFRGEGLMAGPYIQLEKDL